MLKEKVIANSSPGAGAAGSGGQLPPDVTETGSGLGPIAGGMAANEADWKREPRMARRLRRQARAQRSVVHVRRGWSISLW